MPNQTRWIVAAIAGTLWVAPAFAQTGATSDSARAGTGAATSAPTQDDQRGVPGGTARDSSAAGPSGGTVAPSTTGSGSSSDRGLSGTTSATPGTTGGTSGTTPTTKSPGRSASAQSSTTLQKLHAGNQAEIQAGQWMQQHAQNSKVKDFAKKMVKEHTDMDKDVQDFAQKQGLSLTGGASSDPNAAKSQEHMKSMQGMSGAQAERHYMSMMVDDHQRDVSEVRSAAEQAKSSDDKDLAKLLDKTAKKMEDHLKDAQKIQRDMTSRQARTPGQ